MMVPAKEKMLAIAEPLPKTLHPTSPAKTTARSVKMSKINRLELRCQMHVLTVHVRQGSRSMFNLGCHSPTCKKYKI